MTVGNETPFIKYIRVFECSDVGTKRPVSWSTVTLPPEGFQRLHHYQLVIECEIGLESDNFLMMFHAKLGGKW